MGLIRTAIVFGLGYAVGHPQGRAKLTELAQRPEVARLKEQGAGLARKAGVRSGSGSATTGPGTDDIVQGAAPTPPDLQTSATVGSLPPSRP